MLIVNPTAGRGAAGKSVSKIQSTFRQHNLDFDLALTQQPWDAAALAQKSIQAGFDVVVAVGGDGTVNEVINGIMLANHGSQNSVSLGVLPIGGGNDFAYGAGIPLDFDQSIQTLIEGQSYKTDIGRLTGGFYPEGRYFCNGIGIGFDAVVSFIASKLGLRGFLGYFIAMLQTIYRYFKAPLLKIEYDDQTVTQRALMVSVMNGKRMGGGFLLAPQGQMGDGKFDILIADDLPPSRIFPLIPRFLKGTQYGHPAIHNGYARKVTVAAVEGVIPAHADGEPICTECSRLTLEIIPGAINLILPKSA
jgi:YegS/Rv2252/BmrU family lipid kinase